jgi:hypothetical protein
VADIRRPFGPDRHQMIRCGNLNNVHDLHELMNVIQQWLEQNCPISPISWRWRPI